MRSRNGPRGSTDVWSGMLMTGCTSRFVASRRRACEIAEQGSCYPIPMPLTWRAR